MRLNDPLPDTIEYMGVEYNIDLAFDNVLDVYDILKIEDIPPVSIIKVSLSLLLGEDAECEDTVGLWQHIYENYIEMQERKPVQHDILGNAMPVPGDDEDEDETIELGQDAIYIYASFLNAYGIDLYEQQGKMHWWVFRALLQGLPPETIMQRIVQIRLWKPSKGDSSKYKQEMSRLQSYYKLRK